ncbi:NmrA family NAD(P)-binding protein [Nonomuraea sp. NN258]|uniref:NmrA family NAD(P)-binding protein n=1 Tax=Nonomuraea antri TaxID=2730852 RepID=UPI001568214C|nr:NmrA family NAD(P)-binding protein [Nonomuraea antri]NRQ31865.1 NmrA family NAD(P)-binding protein [Nonomuraea antri]
MHHSVRTYAVTAATGHVGGHAARELLRAGHRVRAMGRDGGRLKELEAEGADPFVGDLADRGFVEEAFAEADAALLIVPPHPAAPDFPRYQHRIARVYASAAAHTGLRHAAFISTQGATDDRVDGLIAGHAAIESVLNQVAGLHLVHVQPPSFFEILYYFLGPMRERGVLSSPLGVDAVLRLVGARDVAAVAAGLLADPHFRGVGNVPVPPAELMTMRQIAELISEHLGRPMGVEQISAEADVADLVAAGTGRSFATLLNRTWALATAMGDTVQDEVTAVTRPAYRIEDFIRDELVPAIRSSRPISDYSTATRPRRA